MICPICKKNRTTIISDKFDKFTNSVKRKRYCICGNFFSTFEKFEILRKPKHLDNPNIVKFEDLKPIQKIKKAIVPVNIDISGINAEINEYEKATQTSRPGFKLCKDDELVGIETILGMKA